MKIFLAFFAALWIGAAIAMFLAIGFRDPKYLVICLIAGVIAAGLTEAAQQEVYGR